MSAELRFLVVRGMLMFRLAGLFVGRRIILRRKCCMGRTKVIATKSIFGQSVLSCEWADILRGKQADDGIRYTMLVGKPPFQMKDVKAIYQ